GKVNAAAVLSPFRSAERTVLAVASATTAATSTNPLFGAPVNPLGIQPKLTGFVHNIYVQARTPAQVPAALRQVTGTLSQRHHISGGQTKDFSVNNLSDITSAAEDSSRVMALLLAPVASLS